MRLFSSSIVALAAVLGAPSLSFALPALNTLTSYFDNARLGPADTGVGVGHVTYAGELLTDGTYLLSSIPDFDVNFVFADGTRFAFADLTAPQPTTDLSIVVIGSTFQFSSPGSGGLGGSAEFVSGERLLSVSPSSFQGFVYFLIEGGTADEGSMDATRIYAGNYGSATTATTSAVPEPSTYALLLGSAALGAVIVRRGRRR